MFTHNLPPNLPERCVHMYATTLKVSPTKAALRGEIVLEIDVYGRAEDRAEVSRLCFETLRVAERLSEFDGPYCYEVKPEECTVEIRPMRLGNDDLYMGNIELVLTFF